MNALTRDPLLTIAKAVLMLLTIVLAIGVLACIIAAVGCILAIPPLFIVHSQLAQILTSAFPGCDPRKLFAVIAILLALTIVLLGLVIVCLRRLSQIVDTVGEGDPFVPANAKRLTTMAWLVLAIQIISLPIGAIGAWIAQFDHGDAIHIDAGISGNGLLLMLVLFILARVFRQGTAMREELEGTV